MSIHNEQWRDVVGFEGLYQVSDVGRVRSARDTNRSKVGQILKPGTDPKGYEKVVLCRNGVMKTAKVHHLVLEAFVCIRPDGYICNHKDGVKNNNKLRNLEWVTPSENVQHGFDVLHRNTPRAESHGMSTLNSESIRRIREIYQSGEYTQQEIADEIGTGRTNIQKIVSGQTWRSVENV